MCLWLLTACLGFLPSNPVPKIVVPPLAGVPVPILQPTQAPTVAPTTTITTLPPTIAPTLSTTTAPTTASTTTLVTTLAPPITTVVTTTTPTVSTTTNPGMVSTAIPTIVPTMNPGMVSTAIPTTVPTMMPGMVSTVVSTMNPGIVSTAIPTMVPTTTSSMVPTTSTAIVSTAIPTTVPSTASSMVPTTTTVIPPTSSSTAVPTMAPTTTMIPPTTSSTAAPTMATTTTMIPLTTSSTAAPTMATTTTMIPPMTSSSAVPTMATSTTTTTSSTITSTMASDTTVTPVPTLIITTGEESSPLILCNDPNIVCIINPDEIITGSIPFDPRLGTTPGTSAAYYSSVTGYSAHIPPYNDAVRFPREKRSTIDQIYTKYLSRMSNMNHKIIKRETCVCVPSGMCPTRLPDFGAGLLDVRIVTPAMQCPDKQEYCCTPNPSTPKPTTPTPTPTPVPTIACGTLQRVPTTNISPAAGQASYGEFPWQAAIMTKQNDFIAGGVLIDRFNVLTVTHRVAYYLNSPALSNVKVRLGDWDGIATNEPVKVQEYNVTKTFVHENFNYSTLQNDLTILRLETPVPFTPAAGAALTINRACLPPSSTAIYDGRRCKVSGWGKNMFGMAGQYQTIIKKIDVPIVSAAMCQNQLRATRLGANFVLDATSFICAGGEPNKDSCTGDGGSGLVCEVNGQWVVVGLVAWGLGCASPNVPGVYVNIATLLPWIQQQIAMP